MYGTVITTEGVSSHKVEHEILETTSEETVTETRDTGVFLDSVLQSEGSYVLIKSSSSR